MTGRRTTIPRLLPWAGSKARRSGLVTVVTPAYKAEAFLAGTISSVREQTHRPLEHLIIDDKSPDNTVQLVQDIASSTHEEGYRLRLVRHRANLGAAAALNTGIKASRADYIAWLSADDLYIQPDKTRIQLGMLAAQPEAAGVFDTQCLRGASVQDSQLASPKWPGSMRASEDLLTFRPTQTLFGLLFANPINGTSVLLRRAALEEAGLFDTSVGSYNADGDLWMRMSALGLGLLPRREVGTFYRQHVGQMSSNTEQMALWRALIRIRMLIVLRREGLLDSCVRANWRTLKLALQAGEHVRNPYVVETLCKLWESVPGQNRRTLRAMRHDINDQGLIDRSELKALRSQARDLTGSADFRVFLRSLRRHQGSEVVRP